MADRTIAVLRQLDIVERRRYGPNGFRGGYTWLVGMAFETYQPDLMPDQHAWIRRAVRLVTTHAPLELYRGMLKGKGAAKVCVATEAAIVVCVHRLKGTRQESAMGIMAIDAGHSAFRKLMAEGLLKTGPLADMA